MVFGSLLDSVAEAFQVTRSSPSPSVLRELGETRMPVSCGPLPLQSGVIIPRIWPRYEDHHFLYGREAQETSAVTGGRGKVMKEEEKAHGESGSNNHGNPEPRAGCSGFVIESCSVSTSSSA